jgi:putative drug exporter of the RND superfamily
MTKLIQNITDLVTSKKGMWITLAIWFFAAGLLGTFAPSAKDYEVTSIDSLSDETQSVIAQTKVDQYFKNNEGIPAILVFQTKKSGIEISNLAEFFSGIDEGDIEGVKEIVPLTKMPPHVAANFISKDQTTVIIPLTFESSLENKEIRSSLEKVYDLSAKTTDYSLYITGPAGIGVDTLNLFSRADLVLLFSTVGLILILLIVIYRSPLLALIPLLAAAFVYEVVNQILGLMGKAGVLMNSQTLSIMTILLFASVIDYSLFVFSRFREELKNYDNKFDAMKWAMRETGLPVFFSGGTVLAAMLVLFFANFADYRNFAPIFATTMVVVMFASITLVPALFTLFGRKSFWPKIPHVGEEKVLHHSFWSKVGRFVVKKPVFSVSVISIILLVSASNMLNLNYEFDTIKSFPEDMPSRKGYEILEEKFEKGDLAPTTVLLESEKEISVDEQGRLMKALAEQSLVNNVRLNDNTENQKVVSFSLTFEESPYSEESMDALENIMDKSGEILTDNNLVGKLYFAGETAKKVDDRSVNNRDLIVIVVLETILILGMLIFLTRSIRMPIYMMGTILMSFLAAVGLGMFLSSLFFDIDAISNRVPLYSFVFLVALGIDYNIILISRFMEEKRNHSVKKAVEIAVSTTGGVISSAGILLAATFAVLMTQPIQILFTFGFIVAVGIILDTFLIRGILLPSLIVLFEKDKKVETAK